MRTPLDNQAIVKELIFRKAELEGALTYFLRAAGDDSLALHSLQPPQRAKINLIVEPHVEPLILKGGGSLPVEAEKEPRISPNTFKNLVAWRAVQKLLQTTNKPMRTAQISAALSLGGFTSTSQDLRGFLFQVLRRKNDVFYSPEKGFWSLTVWR